jgi:hypothetical protein
VTSKPEIIPGKKSGWRTLSATPFLKSLRLREFLPADHVTKCSRTIVSKWIGSVNTSAFVRTHLASFAKRRERAYYSHRTFTTMPFHLLGK